MKKFLLFISLLFTGCIFAQPGTLDTTFGVNGIVNVPAEQPENALAITSQSDGKIIAGGYHFYSLCIKRYNSDGSPDTSFGNQGSVIQSFNDIDEDVIYAIKVQPDGKIVAMGMLDHNEGFFIARYNSNGTVDNSFGTGGSVFMYPHPTYGNSAHDLFIQNDGKIIITGCLVDGGTNTYYPFIARFNSNGEPDTTFGGGYGYIIDQNRGVFRSTTIQPDGKIIFLTYYFSNGNENPYPRFTRYNTSGEPDETFGNGGSVVIAPQDENFEIEMMGGITVSADGTIIAAGVAKVISQNIYLNPILMKLQANGSLDTSFDNDGISVAYTGIVTIFPNWITLQPDGKMIVYGTMPNNFALARFNANGTIDTGFGDNGFSSVSVGNNPYYYARSMTLLPDGKIAIAGMPGTLLANFVVMRFNGGEGTNGLEENALQQLTVYPNPTESTLNISNPENIQFDKLTITDITGKTVMQLLGHNLQIDVQNLSPGIYFLTAESGSKQHLHRFIKQ